MAPDSDRPRINLAFLTLSERQAARRGARSNGDSADVRRTSDQYLFVQEIKKIYSTLQEVRGERQRREERRGEVEMIKTADGCETGEKKNKRNVKDETWG